MKPQKTFLWFFLFTLFYCSNLFAQSHNNTSASGAQFPAKHTGAVSALVLDEAGRILSSGEDGFLQIWNTQAAEERFQLSPYAIRSMVQRPGKTQVALIEHDGLSLYRISAWDYIEKKNLFTLSFNDSVSYINYSAAGSFIIAAGSGRSGVQFIDSETGETLDYNSTSDTLSFSYASTSRSERIMISYLVSGVLSYWDLESGLEIERFDVPSNIRQPVLFGSNRFFAGFDYQGLVIIDAVTGLTLARDDTLKQGVIFPDNSGNNSGTSRFYCLSSNGRMYTVNRMGIELSGRMTTLSRMNVPSGIEPVTAAPGEGEAIILGTDQGALWLLNRTGSRIMNTGNHERIIDASVSQTAIGFITENGKAGFIPLDFARLVNNRALAFENAHDPSREAAYTGITSEPGTGIPQGNPPSHFLLWQPGVNLSIPMVKTIYTLSNTTQSRSTPPNRDLPLDKQAFRFPLRSTAIMGNSILLLDTTGAISVLDLQSGDTRFSYSASGSHEAAFIDENTIIISRSVVSGSSPFLIVNLTTGETVPLAYPAMAGIRAYRGLSGAMYGALVNRSGISLQTSIIRLNTSNPAQSELLVEYNGEDTFFAMAESGGNFASSLGGNGAFIFLNNRAGEKVYFERSSGLPVKILNGGGRWFIVLDGEGTITWHDNRTGRLLASFRLYPNTWVLEKSGTAFSNRETIQGRTTNS